MDASLPRKFRRRDTSPEHPGKIFYQYKNGHEYWVTPERFEKNDQVRKKLTAKWQKDHSVKRNQDYLKWLSKPGKMQIKKQAYQKWVDSAQGRVVKRRIHQRHLSTIHGTICNRLRSRIHHAMKRGETKSASAVELIGCSIANFRKHLESQFSEGMSWKNLGAWEIDHRAPLSSFNLADPEQQKVAFNYHNCQPMWKKANRVKNDKIEGELFRGRHYQKCKIIPFKAA